ncbi:MAG TPA: protein translocase subunit SecF [Alphaproteobacteria bacterium]|nr:protein translocase subunit SecF [Alphaproteobacteria bacterium]
MGIRFIPDNTRYDFAGNRYFAFAVDGLLALITVVALFVYGLNLGIDFTGGVVVEISRPEGQQKPISIGEVREKMEGLGFGEVGVQSFDNDKAVLIRVQPQEGVTNQEQQVVAKIRTALGDAYKFDRVEAVGPKVSGELFTSGVIATLLAVLMIAVYVAFRFEWQYGVAAVVATGHDVLMGVGLFAVLGLDFNMTSVAALLLLAGYSVNDTVVVFDRIRENRRRYKSMPLPELINTSVNVTLGRTILTSSTTALAVVPLLFSGETLFGFAACILWGILIGTYSSIFVAAALLLYLPSITASAPSGGSGEGLPAQT